MIIIPKFVSVFRKRDGFPFLETAFRKRDGFPFLETAVTSLSFLQDEAGLLCALSFEKP